MTVKFCSGIPVNEYDGGSCGSRGPLKRMVLPSDSTSRQTESVSAHDCIPITIPRLTPDDKVFYKSTTVRLGKLLAASNV